MVGVLDREAEGVQEAEGDGVGVGVSVAVVVGGDVGDAVEVGGVVAEGVSDGVCSGVGDAVMVALRMGRRTVQVGEGLRVRACRCACRWVGVLSIGRAAEEAVRVAVVVLDLVLVVDRVDIRDGLNDAVGAVRVIVVSVVVVGAGVCDKAGEVKAVPVAVLDAVSLGAPAARNERAAADDVSVAVDDGVGDDILETAGGAFPVGVGVCDGVRQGV